jgi:glutamyl endopeptidase
MGNEDVFSSTVTRPAAGRNAAPGNGDGDDLTGGGPVSAGRGTPAAPTTPRYPGRAGALGQNEVAVGEVIGDAAGAAPIEATPVAANAHQEFSNGAESAEESIEATPEQLAAAEAGEETATGDLRGIEGYEPRESAQEGDATQFALLREAGATGDPREEFFPFLAALVPTLISSIGPAVAKGVMGKLSPRSKNVIKRIATGAAKAAPAAGGASSILSVLAKLFEAAQLKPGGESGMETEEASTIVEEAAAVLEVIIGSDDRVPITATTEVPWRRICALRIQFPSGTTYRGTGFLVGPRAVVTAGHCVYLHNEGGWARKVEVIPGCNGSARPYGQAESNSLRSVGGWVTSRLPESDYGCIILPAGAFNGRNLGSFGFASFDPPNLVAKPAVVAGYPGDKPFAQAWGMARKIKTVNAKTLVYDIDTMGGQSGAPVYIKRNGVRYVVGIHNYGAATGNSATRVTQPVMERLLAWSKM